MKQLDLPPVWLLGFLVLAWGVSEGQSALWPGLDGLWARPFGGALVIVGVALMIAAVWQMLRHRTTFIPRQRPSALVTEGVFALSRNPIYLGDAFVLAGAALYWGAIPALVLVPVFMWLISWRFIEGEEERLHDAFGAEFDAYRRETRRWL